MKAARGLVDAGLVSLNSADGGKIRGLAGHGKMKFASGLAIRSSRDVDNLCTCPVARRGMICEHSIAVALLFLKPQGAPSPAGSLPSSPSNVTFQPLQNKRAPKRVPGQYTAYLPENLLLGIPREPVGVYVKFQPGGEGEESLLAAWLAEKGVLGQSAPLSMSATLFAEFLESAADHPRLIAGKPSGGGAEVSIAAEAVRLPLRVESLGDSGNVNLSLDASGQSPLLKSQPAAWWACRETVTVFKLPNLSKDLTQLVAELPCSRPLRWFIANRESVTDAFYVELQGEALCNFHVAPLVCEFELALEGSLQSLEVTVSALHQGKCWFLSEKSNLETNDKIYPIQDQLSKGVYYVQNVDAEFRLFAFIKGLGFKLSSGISTVTDVTPYRLVGAEAVMGFYASELPRLKKLFRVVEGERWTAATKGISRILPQIRQRPVDAGGSSSGSDWLAMEFGYEAPDGFRLPRAEVLRLVRSGQRSVQGKNGKKYLLDLQSVEEFEDTLRDVPLQLTPDGARISALHSSYFNQGDLDEQAGLPDEASVLSQLGELGARLRPYQLLGVRWMDSLVQAGRGGVLGDEMGLGKTVQSIALVKMLIARRLPEDRKPVLIVCPKSLTGNWRAEFERFAPHLKVIISQGANRAAVLKTVDTQDVIITTYQLVVRDLEILKKSSWSLLLLDEASYIRNPDTDASKAIRSLPCNARLALTGTPVENSTRDLWAIYQFALPGYLGSRDNFKERFEQPIQGGMDTPAGISASERLKKLLRPYFLRRTKREVLKDLPEKIEQVLWCDPSPAQAEVYRRLLEEGREEIKAARKRSGQGGAKMTMFTVLLRLRQACCDLRLTGLQKDTLGDLEPDDLSGKWPMLLERLEAILEGGGKVLIFSQFVQFLKLVREALEGRQISYAYLDGSSNDREAQVKSFQTEKDRRVFLISLKAGGYGLNLTAADHVILLDPWWNPAVESQAIDRAHRIGQQRPVTVYRLIVRDSIEEKILELHRHKRDLASDLLEGSEISGRLSDDDLLDLIRG
ncbi:MAG: SNF2-related protein [Verrucomicrobia bacterium]|nr:SNF2-related protein [Verrucomicrobiota bacterium]